MISIQYQIEGRDGRIETREKEFKNEAAMQRWVAKQEATNGKFLGVTAYSA